MMSTPVDVFLTIMQFGVVITLLRTPRQTTRSKGSKGLVEFLAFLAYLIIAVITGLFYDAQSGYWWNTVFVRFGPLLVVARVLVTFEALVPLLRRVPRESRRYLSWGTICLSLAIGTAIWGECASSYPISHSLSSMEVIRDLRASEITGIGVGCFVTLVFLWILEVKRGPLYWHAWIWCGLMLNQGLMATTGRMHFWSTSRSWNYADITSELIYCGLCVGWIVVFTVYSQDLREEDRRRSSRSKDSRDSKDSKDLHRDPDPRDQKAVPDGQTVPDGLEILI